MVFLDKIFNPVLQPLLNISPFLTLVVLALIISLLITLVYKFFTNQGKMKEMKEKQKDYQKRMKELRTNPEEMMKVQKEAMKVNMEYMKMSFKPTLITMIPILLIFGWMAAHLSYEPLLPGQTYTITAMFDENVVSAELVTSENLQLISESNQSVENHKVAWSFKSKVQGEHTLTVRTANDELEKTIIITTDQTYLEPTEPAKPRDLEIKQVVVNHNKLMPLKNAGIPWLSSWGWLGWYILLSLVFSMSLRKALKIY